jgi:hypothetical protein
MVDDVDAIRARYVEADAEASDQYAPHVRTIRRSLDDIPALLDEIADERLAVVQYLRDYAALSVSLTQKTAVVELANRIERGEHRRHYPTSTTDEDALS